MTWTVQDSGQAFHVYAVGLERAPSQVLSSICDNVGGHMLLPSSKVYEGFYIRGPFIKYVDFGCNLVVCERKG